MTPYKIIIVLLLCFVVVAGYLQSTSTSTSNYVIVHFHSKVLEVYSGNRVIYKTDVVGGLGYDRHQFSNVPGSHMSSLGRYKVGERHQHNGLAWRMYGLDSTNSNAHDRYILIHAAAYVPGGYSWGCFAITYAARDKLATLLTTGTYLEARDD